MWLMPSFGRPDAPGRMVADAPADMPTNVCVLVNADDPEYDNYVIAKLEGRWGAGWRMLTVPAGSRFASAVRYAFEELEPQPFYGILDDDYWPVTPGWHTKMVEAAGPNAISIANNKVNFPSLYTCRVMGGELARAIGTIAPGKMAHNYSDDTWATFAQDFNLLRPLEDVIVEHRHWSFDKSVAKDDTYVRGSGDFDEDTALYGEWRNSDERREQAERVAKLLGITIAISDFKDVRLLMLTPIQNHAVDVAFHHSFGRTQKLLSDKKINRCIQEQTGSSHIGKARESLLWAGLKVYPDATHILFIDDDMGWEPEIVTRLLAAGHEFSAIAGRKKIDPLSMCFNAYPDPQILHPRTKFMRVLHVGFAFVMLKRSVIDKMCEAYPELEYNTENTGRQFALFLDLMWKRVEKELPERLSEDFSFCQRWNAIGGEIWIDPSSSLIHAGRKEYIGAAGELLTPMTKEEAEARFGKIEDAA